MRQISSLEIRVNCNFCVGNIGLGAFEVGLSRVCVGRRFSDFVFQPLRVEQHQFIPGFHDRSAIDHLNDRAVTAHLTLNFSIVGTLNGSLLHHRNDKIAELDLVGQRPVTP